MAAAGPLVFQCIGCRTILGDSLRITTSVESLNSIALDVCANLTRSTLTLTSSVGADRGAIYHMLHCAHCDAVVGKAYVSTPPHLAVLERIVTLDISALQSYPFGQAAETASSLRQRSPTVGPPRVVEAATTATLASSSNTPVAPGIPSTVEDEIRAELIKVQTIILSLNERVRNIEGRMPDTDESERGGKRRKSGGGASSAT